MILSVEAFVCGNVESLLWKPALYRNMFCSRGDAIALRDKSKMFESDAGSAMM
jgi:hypothetical protein